MKKSNLATYALFPAIIFFAVLIGGIVYSHTAFLPAYLSDLPHSSVVVSGKYGVNEAPFWTTLHPLLILSLLSAFFLNWKFAARRKLIAVTLAIYTAVLLVTALYFVPELMAFADSANSTLPDAEWFMRGHRWQKLSLIRGAFCLIAFIPLLLALARPESETNERASVI